MAAVLQQNGIAAVQSQERLVNERRTLQRVVDSLGFQMMVREAT